MVKRQNKLPTPVNRREFIRRNWTKIEREGWTQPQIAKEIARTFDSKIPSIPTISQDISQVKAQMSGESLTDAAKDLLHPDNFPDWREKLFGYVTSTTQHALYWVLRGLALKEDIPTWVIEHFSLPETVNEDVQEKEKLMTFILLVAPRHGKTMTMVHGLIHLYCSNPDLRVIYCQGVATTTQDINKLIMLEMEDNEQLRDWYGPFRSDDRQWSGDHGFVLAKRKRHSITPSFLPVGITSNIRSRDADIIIIDDPQDQRRAESEADSQRDYNTITGEFMTRREPHTPVLGIGSHVATLWGDIWTRIEENLDDIRTEGQEIHIRKRPAHDEENCKVWSGEEEEHWDCLEWPEFRGWDFLMAMKGMLGEDLFRSIYQQDNRIEGTRPFDPDKVKAFISDGGILDPRRSWKKIPDRCLTDGCRGSLYIGLGFDPATGEGKRSSYTALATIAGCLKCNMLYLVDYEQKRVSPDMHPGMIDTWTHKDTGYKTHMVRIEINAYQKALARDPRVRDAARKNKFQVDEWMTDDRKNTPEFGIPQLANYVRDGLFSVPAATETDLKYGKDLEKALIRYPNKPNDIPMAIWLAAGAVWMLWDLYANLDPIYLKHRQRNVPQYMIEEPLKVNIGAWREMDEYGNNYGLEDVGV